MLRDAIHLVNGDSASFQVAQTGLRFLADRDMLAVGPVRRDQARHTRLRDAFWKSEYRLGGWRWSPPAPLRWPRAGKVAIWTSSWFPEQLFFWRAVDVLATREIELWRVEAKHPRFVIEGVGTMPPESVPYSLQQAKRMSRAEVNSARRAWGSFTAGDLPAVVGTLDPSLKPRVLESLPRIEVRGTLRLSVRDEALLKPFDNWKKPLDALRPSLPELLVFGDLVVLTRLRRWVRAGALKSRRVRGKSSWTGRELVLTDHGHQLLVRLQWPSQAPSMSMGGHRIYGPQTWAVTETGTLKKWRPSSTPSARASSSGARGSTRARHGRAQMS